MDQVCHLSEVVYATAEVRDGAVGYPFNFGGTHSDSTQGRLLVLD